MIPRRIKRRYQLGFASDSDDATLLKVTVQGDRSSRLVPDRLLVVGDFSPTELTHNGDVMAAAKEDFTPTTEYVDEDDARWRDSDFAPPVVPGSYEVEHLLPLLAAGDVVTLRVERAGEVDETKYPFACLLGDVYEEDSDVEPWELRFDSDRLVEVGESIEMRGVSDRAARIDRLFVVNPRAFVIEAVSVADRNQLAVGVSAAILTRAPVRMESLRDGMEATLRVRCVAEVARRFRGRLIGFAYKPTRDA